MKTISIIILNYNGYSDTKECLDSLLHINYPQNYITRIIIVDNNSTNDSVNQIINWFDNSNQSYLHINNTQYSYNNEKFILLSSSENLGFSGGNNLGIKFAQKEFSSDYFLLLNNDTIVDSNFLLPLISTIESDTSIGIVGSEIHDYYNHEEYTLGGKINYIKGSGYHSYNNRILNKKYISFTSGCIWLISSEALEKCGLLDESYFLYVEDVEYCHRMIENGYHITCNADSVIFHKESRSTEYKPIIYYYNTRNRLYFCSHIDGHGFHKILFRFYFFFSRFITFIIKPNTRKYIIDGYKDYKNGIRGKYEK